MNELAGVRWLARAVLAPALADFVEEVPAPFLVSDHPDESDRTVRDYVLWWVAHSQRGS